MIPFGKYNPFAVDDEDTIVMEYDTGMTASFILTTGEACCEERMEIIGTKARLLLEDNTLSITRFDDIEKYIKTEDVNSREHLHFTEEKIMYEKSAEPYTQPVSYTHLDVYKRQAVEWMDRGITVLSETPAALDIEALKKLYGYYKAGKKQVVAEQYREYPSNKAALRLIGSGIIAVSYTHLNF